MSMQAGEVKTRVVVGSIASVVVASLLALASWTAIGSVVLVLLCVVALIGAALEVAWAVAPVTEEPRRIGIWIQQGIVALAALCLAGIKISSGTILPSHTLAVIALSSLLLTVLTLGESRHDLEKGVHTFTRLFVVIALLIVGGLSAITIASHAPGQLFWLIAVVAVNDTGAYFGGRALGKLKLAPAISPGKTIAGSVIGLASGLLIGVVLGLIVPLGLSEPLWGSLTLALLVVVAGQVGDLLKSVVKRLSGVKDFGSVLPGHGGILDRIDGILAAAPFVLLVCR